MDLLVVWQILSLLGAALAAFAVGYWVRSARHRAGAAAVATRAAAEDEADRERLKRTLDRVQTELDAARTRLEAVATEHSRLLAEHAHSEAENRELGQTVLDFGVAQSRLEAEALKLREDLGRARHAEQGIEAERKARREVERSEREAQATAERWLHELGETRKQLAAERRERARVEQERDTTQAAMLGLQVEGTRLGDALEQSHRQLRQSGGQEQELAGLRSENERLRGELAALAETASVGGSADIDREELEVRLATAVAHMRRARREAEVTRSDAERLRTEVRRLSVGLESLRPDAEERKRADEQREQLLAGQRAATEELRSTRARLEQALAAAETSDSRAQEAEARAASLGAERGRAERELGSLRERLKAADARLGELAQVREENRELRALRLELEAAHAKLGDLGRLRDDHDALREEHGELARATRELAQAQAETQRLRLELQSQAARVQEAGRVTEENRALRDEVTELRELRPAALELERLGAEHKRLRLDWELATQKLGELERQRGELSELRARLADLEALETEVVELRERERSLEAQLFAVGHTPATRPLLTPATPPVSGTTAASMESGLERLRQEQRLRSAALADAQGLLVASAGDALTQEGLAAFSALSSELAERVRTLLPLAEVKLVRLVDANQVTVACRLFGVAGEEYGLSTIGAEDLDVERADEAARSLSEAISTGRGGSEEP